MRENFFYISLLVLLGGIIFLCFGNPANAQSPYPPEKLSPEPGAVIAEFPLELSWRHRNSNQQTFNYEIYPGFIEEFNRDNMREGGMVTVWSVGIFYLSPGQYTWRVQSCEFEVLADPPYCRGTSPWVFQSFTVEKETLPPSPTGDLPPPTFPTYPTDGATNIPLFLGLEWEDIIEANNPGFWNRAKGYLYSYWSEGEERNKIENMAVRANVSINLATGGKTYFWQVRSCSDENDITSCGSLSETWSFTTVDCPEGQSRPHYKCEKTTCKEISYCGVSDCDLGVACTESPKSSFSGDISSRRDCKSDCSACSSESSCSQSTVNCQWDAVEDKCCGALETNWPPSPFGTQLTSCSLTVLVKYIYEWGIGIGGLAAFIALVIAGFQYLTSAGNAIKMGDAMKRMHSAVLGLVLLLGSVLILNTINPQLTTLKMPEINTGIPEIGITIDKKVFDISRPCEKVLLCSGYNRTSCNISLSSGDEISQSIIVRSVEIIGGCQVKLYQLPYYKTNFDNLAVSVSHSINDIRTQSETGTTQFRSVQVINLFSK